jgi:hypothetical protein
VTQYSVGGDFRGQIRLSAFLAFFDSLMKSAATNHKTQILFEKKWKEAHLDRFDERDSHAAKRLIARFDALNRQRLVTLGRVLSEQLRIRLPRECQRRSKGMFWWFDQHWPAIQPTFDNYVVVTLEDGRTV